MQVKKTKTNVLTETDLSVCFSQKLWKFRFSTAQSAANYSQCYKNVTMLQEEKHYVQGYVATTFCNGEQYGEAVGRY